MLIYISYCILPQGFLLTLWNYGKRAIQIDISDSSLSNIVQDQEQDSGHSACSSITAVGEVLCSPHSGLATDRSFAAASASVSSASSFAGSDITSSTLVANNATAENDNCYSGSVSSTSCRSRVILLPWGSKDRSSHPQGPCCLSDMDIRPGEFVMRTLFSDFTVQAGKKIEAVMGEPHEKSLSKLLQRGEDALFDQLLSSFGSVAEHCLPSLLRALFSWYERQMSDSNSIEQRKIDQKGKR